MATHRIFLPQKLKANTLIEITDKECLHRLTRVLRTKINEEYQVFNLQDGIYNLVIKQINAKKIIAQLSTQIDAISTPKVKVHIAQCVSLPKRMDYTVQKSTELSASELTPIFSQYTNVKLYNSNTTHKIEHWNKIIINAAEQSNHTHLLKINDFTDFKSFVTMLNIQKIKNKIILHEKGSQLIDSTQILSGEEFVILIGCEGGFSQEEIEFAVQNGFTKLTLGDKIFRTETVCVIILSLINYINKVF